MLFLPCWLLSSLDTEGRYSYENQPKMCYWNCERLAEALEPLLPLSVSKPILKSYWDEYHKAYYHKMRQKVRRRLLEQVINECQAGID